MNNLRNRVQLIGNIGSTPVLQQTSNGKVYSKISLATNSTYVDKEGNKVKETQWHPIVVWGKKAEIAENPTAKKLYLGNTSRKITLCTQCADATFNWFCCFLDSCLHREK